MIVQLRTNIINLNAVPQMLQDSESRYLLSISHSDPLLQHYLQNLQNLIIIDSFLIIVQQMLQLNCEPHPLCWKRV